jgi:hypothetical protein
MLPSVYSTYCFYSFLRLTQWVHDLNILCYEHVLVMIVHAKNSIGVVMFSQSPLESTFYGTLFAMQQFYFSCLLIIPAVDSSSNSHGHGTWNLGDCPM